MSKSKTSLIAMVATAVVEGGERRIVQPGEALPELNEPDKGALLTARAAREQQAEDPKPAAAEAPAAPTPPPPAEPPATPAPAATPARAKR